MAVVAPGRNGKGQFSAQDLTGQRFGRLVVMHREETRHGAHRRWVCRCDCGAIKAVNTGELLRGDTSSCGCLRREMMRDAHYTHRQSKTSLYKIWAGMKDRCSNPNSDQWANYGGRGIHVCERWLDFANFADDMGPRPDHMSIERINNHGNYEPGNCRWATQREQSRNTRQNRLITYDGITQTATDWAEQQGGTVSALLQRIGRLHWPIERALNTPFGRGRQWREIERQTVQGAQQ